MTDLELLSILENGGKLPLPYFNGSELIIEADDVAPEECLPVLKQLLRLSAENRRADTRHLMAYLNYTIMAVGEEDALWEMGGAMPTEETVWQHVTPHYLLFAFIDPGKYVTRRTIYAVMRGGVGWEPEHGIEMSWEDGKRLVRLSAISGHPTNGYAAAKPERDQYVFYGHAVEYCTYPDPT